MPVRNLFVIALAFIVSVMCYSTASRNRYANLFAEAVETIESEALQQIPTRQLFNYAMDGMTSKLDGHSHYITDEMYRIFNEELQQEFGGVGMYVDNDPENGKLTVLAPIPGTPAFKAGVRAGDEIVQIEGKPTDDMNRSEAIELIRGPRGEPVNVVVARKGKEHSFDLVREFIHEPSVHGDFRQADGAWIYKLKDYPNVGYIRLLQFGSKSADEMREALTVIGSEVDALILDLRNNSGGVLNGAVEICDMFLEPSKAIVSTRGRENVVLMEYTAHEGHTFPGDKPIVILINRESASASEIVAACLQDHQRAVLIGENSWGKGTVQHVIPIECGKSALKLTTQSYWRPSGVNIDRYAQTAKESGNWGVSPNENMSLDLTEEEIFDNRRRRSLQDLRGLITPEELKDRDEDKLIETADKPLQRAIKYLKSKLGNRVAA